jgi:translation elongation factor EF-4
MRADVTAGLYGGTWCCSIIREVLKVYLIGHYERKKKHLDNQRESKKKMKRVGRVDLPQDAFFEILRFKGD